VHLIWVWWPIKRFYTVFCKNHVVTMGSLSKPDPERERRINELLKDLSPGVQDLARKLIAEYPGKDLDEKLTELIGLEKTRKILRK